MDTIKKMIKLFLDFVLFIWSHLPVFCLSDDDNFANAKVGRIKTGHLRISLLNIMMGDNIVYVLSYDIKKRKKTLFYILCLEEIEGNFLKDEQIEQIQLRFRTHIAALLDKDLEIEKEKLLYHINQEEQRITVSSDKANIYATIILAAIPIAIALVDFSLVKSISFIWKVIIGVIVYELINICILIFKTLKVRSIKKSTFSDLRNSHHKNKEIVVQYQYDWQQLKYKAQLFVSFVSNLEEWVLILVLTISITGIVFIYNQENSYQSQKNLQGIVYTVEEENISISHSEAADVWQKVILDLEEEKCSRLIVFVNKNNRSDKLQEINKYKNTQIIIDDQIENNYFKIVEVK